MVATNTKRWTTQDLTSAAVEGTLTYDDLWDAILAIDERFECIPESVGMRWIMEHPPMFERAVGNVSFFILRTLEEIGNAADDDNERMRLGYWFVKPFLCVRSLLDLLGEEERQRMIPTLYAQFGANNHYWADHALELGLSREELGRAIVKRLELEKYESGIVNDVSGFLEYGFTLWNIDTHKSDANDPKSYSLNPTCLWTKITLEHLHQALVICSAKHSSGVLCWKVWMGMRLTLGEEKTAMIVKDAVSRLTSIGEAAPAVLATLTVSERKELAARLKLDTLMSQELKEKTFEFLLSVRDQSEVLSVKDLVLSVQDKLGIDLIYRIIRKRHKIDSEIEKMVRELLIEAGWGGGRIQQGTYQKNAKTYKETQFFVEWQGVKCIQSRDNHRYFPKVGDLVIFRTQDSAVRFLTPKVAAVFFVHVTGI